MPSYDLAYVLLSPSFDMTEEPICEFRHHEEWAVCDSSLMHTAIESDPCSSMFYISSLITCSPVTVIGEDKVEGDDLSVHPDLLLHVLTISGLRHLPSLALCLLCRDGWLHHLRRVPLIKTRRGGHTNHDCPSSLFYFHGICHLRTTFYIGLF